MLTRYDMRGWLDGSSQPPVTQAEHQLAMTTCEVDHTAAHQHDASYSWIASYITQTARLLAMMCEGDYTGAHRHKAAYTADCLSDTDWTLARYDMRGQPHSSSLERATLVTHPTPTTHGNGHAPNLPP